MEGGCDHHFLTPFPGDPGDPRDPGDPGDPRESSRRLDCAVIYNVFSTFSRKVTPSFFANSSHARILSAQCPLCIEKTYVLNNKFAEAFGVPLAPPMAAQELPRPLQDPFETQFW